MTKLNTTKTLTAAEKNTGFSIHALVFVLTIAGLAAIDLLTGGKIWVQWPLLGWGVGLLAHWWWGVGPGAGKAKAAIN